MITNIENFLSEECNFDLAKIINESNKLRKLQFLQEGINAIVTTDETKLKFGVIARELFKKFKAIMPDQAMYEFKPKRDVINALYSTINERVDQADVTHIVREIQSVVNKSIDTFNIELEKLEGFGQKIDISGLDFKKIEDEFLKLDGKQNIAIQSLKSKIENKINRMIDNNPLRVDFYERYQEIISDYNQGKDYRAVKEIFDELILLLGDLSDEDKRSERENLEEDELLVFDMLSKEQKISDKEKDNLKYAAKLLLKKLKEKEFKVEKWSEKIQTSAAVKRVIEDHLFEHLPSSYDQEDLTDMADLLFNDFKIRYATFKPIAA